MITARNIEVVDDKFIPIEKVNKRNKKQKLQTGYHKGPYFVYFDHDAVKDNVNEYAIGLDIDCANGKKLTSTTVNTDTGERNNISVKAKMHYNE